MTRAALTLLFLLVIQAGLFARLAPEAAPCLSLVTEHCALDAEPPSHDPCGDPDGCPDGCPDGDNCPLGGHHHAGCAHHLPVAPADPIGSRLIPPSAVALGHEFENLRVPDGPVQDLDKPPLN